MFEMAAGFSHSISLAGGLNPSASPCHRHARSTSLPCPSHPALANLRLQIRSLRPSPQPDGHPAERIEAAIVSIDRIHAALDGFLRLPLARDPLRRGRPAWADRLLDDLLHLADAHGRLRSAALALKQHHSEARAAIRRRDPGRLASAVRAFRREAKALDRLASSVGTIARQPHATADEAEIAGAMKEAVAATAASSAAIFAGVAALASAAATAATGAAAWKGWSMVLSPTKRRWSSEQEEAAEMVALGKLEAWEERIEGLEKGSEWALRSLVNTRVLLLNILTPSL
ncbi:hypothetical protein Cni_G27402 [Canna indica]|uniref:Uncharacterized protein n=1 Tax=Canna indica TaxID=4628 RepID=A0AAQ3L1K7_9LILI|nr:hypothetical protein Cni_G27402 [Canna indica]